MDSLTKREIILDNYSNPFNKVNEEVPGYLKENSRNESCIDNIDLCPTVKRVDLIYIIIEWIIFSTCIILHYAIVIFFLCCKISANYNDRFIVEGTDFTVSYRNNVNVGVGEIVLKGINNFTGQKIIKLR